MATTIDPSVTAVLLSFNRPDALERTIKAIRGQTVLPSRLLVIDNGSRNETRQFLAELAADWGGDFPLQIVRLLTNLGVGAGHAVGWSLALADEKCELVWSIEHDCEPLPNVLEILVSDSRRNPELGAIATWPAHDEAELKELQERPRPKHRHFTFNATLFTRSAIERCGAPRTDLFCGREDFEYGRKLEANGIEHSRAEAWTLHESKGAARMGKRPSPLRSYYAIRNDTRIDLETRRFRALPQAALRLIGGSVLTLRRDKPRWRHLRARWTAIRDAFIGRLGPTRYRFLQRDD